MKLKEIFFKKKSISTSPSQPTI